MLKKYLLIKFKTLIFFFALTLSFTALAKKNIGILVYDNVLTSDVTAPSEVFGVATKKSWFNNYNVVLIGVDQNKKVIKTEEGLNLMVDYTIYDSPKLDILIVNSAYSMDHLFKNKDLIRFMKEQSKNTKWLVSNCSGAFLYGHAGLLDGYRATTWAGGEKSLKSKYPKINVVEDRNVVVDRNRITTNGGIPSYQGALVLLTMISGERLAKEVFETIQLNRLIKWESITKFIPKTSKSH